MWYKYNTINYFISNEIPTTTESTYVRPQANNIAIFGFEETIYSANKFNPNIYNIFNILREKDFTIIILANAGPYPADKPTSGLRPPGNFIEKNYMEVVDAFVKNNGPLCFYYTSNFREHKPSTAMWDLIKLPFTSKSFYCGAHAGRNAIPSQNILADITNDDLMMAKKIGMNNFIHADSINNGCLATMLSLYTSVIKSTNVVAVPKVSSAPLISNVPLVPNISADDTVNSLKKGLSLANDMISALKLKETSANETINSLKKDLSLANDTINSLKKDLSLANDTINSLKLKENSANETINSLKKDLSSANETINSLKKDLSSATKIVEKPMATLTNETATQTPVNETSTQTPVGETATQIPVSETSATSVGETATQTSASYNINAELEITKFDNTKYVDVQTMDEINSSFIDSFTESFTIDKRATFMDDIEQEKEKTVSVPPPLQQLQPLQQMQPFPSFQIQPIQQLPLPNLKTLNSNMVINLMDKTIEYTPTSNEVVVILAPPGHYRTIVADQIRHRYSSITSPADIIKPGLYMTLIPDNFTPEITNSIIRYVYIDVKKDAALKVALHGEKSKINAYYSSGFSEPIEKNNILVHKISI
jgi:vacuolar-type H+-ATPase subunit H